MSAASDLLNIAERVEKATYKAFREVGRSVDKIAKESARGATGDGALTGKHRPIKLRTRTQMRGDVRNLSVIVWGVPPGPWRWVNDGTKPHDIRRRKRGPMRKMTVRHPGTSGKGSWDRAERIAADQIPMLVFRAVNAAVKVT